MISVILATKNGGKFLSKSVASVLDQTYKDLELIIVSDGSTDNTFETAQFLAATDSRIKVIELKENVGPGLARNKAINECHGEYIAIIDDDDIWLSTEKLSTQKEYLDIHRDVVAIGASHVEFINGGDNRHICWLDQEKDSEKIQVNMLLHNPIITSSVLFRKDVYIKSGGFRNMRLAEDYDLWLRMGQMGKIENIDGADIQYIVRSGSASRSNKIKMCLVVLQLAKEYRTHYPYYTKALIKGYARLVLTFLRII